MNNITPSLIEPKDHIAGRAVLDCAEAFVLKVAGDKRSGAVENDGEAIGLCGQRALLGGHSAHHAAPITHHRATEAPMLQRLIAPMGPVRLPAELMGESA